MHKKFFDSFGVILEAKRCNDLFKTVTHSSFFLFLCSLLCWKTERNLPEIVQKLHQKLQRLLSFRHFPGHFRALFYYELYFSLDESSPKQQISHCLVVLTFQSTKSINSLTEIEQKW